MDIVKVSQPKGRLDYLDGLRGLSILAVVLYHAYSLWGGYYCSNYDKELYEQNDFLQTIFSKGHLGVQLFFMISGFVIFMTLEKTENIISFAWKRCVRLFPLMLTSGLLIYYTASLISFRPQGQIQLGNLWGSLALTTQDVFGNTWKVQGDYVDGSWWSLVTEVCFYIIAALSFYLLKDKKLYLVTSLYFLYTFTSLYITKLNFDIISGNPALQASLNLYNLLKPYHFEHIGWFLIGMIAYQYKKKRDVLSNTKTDTILFIAKAVLLLLLLTYANTEVPGQEFFPIVLVVFMLPIFSNMAVKILTHRIFIFFGIISFPLYLIHQNLVTGLANQLYVWNSSIPVEIIPILPIAFVSIVSVMLYKLDIKIKPYLNRFAKKLSILK